MSADDRIDDPPARPLGAVSIGNIQRFGVAFFLVGALLAAVLYDSVDPPAPLTDSVSSTEVAVIPAMTDPPRLNGAWYCPVGSSSPEGYADHVVHIANTADSEAVANLQILTKEGPGPRDRIDLAPNSIQRIELSAIQPADAAGAVVEILGGEGSVSHSVTTEFGSTEGPCATEASDTWYFAGGRTTYDSEDYLVLMNPFPETAVFDVTFRAVGRSREPGPLQGAFVGPRSVRLINVNDYVTGEPELAAKVETGRGRLVVERLQVLNGELGPTGAAIQLGATSLSQSWMFTAGRVHDGGDDRLLIYNPYDSARAAELAAQAGVLAGVDGGEDAQENTESADNPDDAVGEDFNDSSGDGSDEDEAGGIESSSSSDALAVLNQDGTTKVSIQLWPLNPTDISTYGVVNIERDIRPGTFVTIDLGDQAERFEFPLPYELGVNVTATEGPPVVAERWQFGATVEETAIAIADGGETASTDGVGDEGNDEDLPVGDAAIDLLPPEDVTELPQPIPTDGLTTSRGTELFSTRWVVPWVTIIDDSTLIAVAALQEASVEVTVTNAAGSSFAVTAVVPKGGREIIEVTSVGGGGAVEVEADVPIAVEAVVVVPDGSFDVVPAIPTLVDPTLSQDSAVGS